jgi:hypothetical protein
VGMLVGPPVGAAVRFSISLTSIPVPTLGLSTMAAVTFVAFWRAVVCVFKFVSRSGAVPENLTRLEYSIETSSETSRRQSGSLVSVSLTLTKLSFSFFRSTAKYVSIVLVSSTLFKLSAEIVKTNFRSILGFVGAADP